MVDQNEKKCVFFLDKKIMGYYILEQFNTS